MNATVRSKVNNLLAMHGLGRLDDPGLPVQLGFLIQDHAHFRQLLSAADPQHRGAMYNALAPNLRFTAKPLDVYIYEAGADAERRQLPTVAPDGSLEPYHVPEIHSAVETLLEDARLQAEITKVVEECVAKGHLTLVCKKCLKEASFAGMTREDAAWKARHAGWGLDGREICPECL